VTVKLRHYAARGNAHRTPLVFVHAPIKRPFILDMVPGRSMMANLTRQGFDVYMVEWIPPARADSWRGFDAYVNQDLGATMRAVQRLTGVSKINLPGYCFGGLLTVLYAALPNSTRSPPTLNKEKEDYAEFFDLFGRGAEEVLAGGWRLARRAGLNSPSYSRARRMSESMALK